MSADLQRVIRIVFQGDNDTQKAFSQLNKGFTDLNSMVSTVTAPLAGVADNIMKVDAALFALAVGGIGLSIREAGNFNDAFNEISTLIDATEPELDAFKETFKAYARETKFELEDLNAAVYESISRYTDYTDALEFVAITERLAIAGKSNLTDATVLMASTMSAYGAEVEEASRYSDVFFTIVKEGGTTLPQVAETLARVTSLAGPMGVSIEEVGAAIATLTARGMKTSEAMTSIVGIMNAVVKPSTQAAEAAESLGIEFSAAALEAKGLDGFLLDVYERTGGNIEVMSQLFGNVQGLSGVMSAFGKDGGDLFIQKLQEVKDAAGATDVAYAKMVENFKYHNTQLVNNIQMTLAEIGTPLLEGYGDLAGSITEIFKQLSVGMDKKAFDPLFQGLDGAIKDLAVYISDVASVLPEALSKLDWSGFLDALKDLGETLGKYLGDTDLRQVDDLSDGLQKVIDVITGLIRVTSGMAEAFRPFINQIIDFFVELSKGDEEAQRIAGQIIGLAKAIESAGLIVVGVLLSMEGSGASWGRVFGGVAGTASLAWNILKGIVLEVMLAITEGALQLNQIMNAMTLGKVDFFGESIASLKLFKEVLRDSRDEAEEMARGGMAKLVESFREGTAEAGVLKEAIDEVPGKKSVTFTIEELDQARAELISFGHDLEGLTDDQIIELRAIHDQVSFALAEQAVEDLADNIDAIPSKKKVDIYVDDHGTTQIVQTQIDQIAEEVEVVVRAELDLEYYRTQMASLDNLVTGYYDTIQTGIEWEAKLQIAEVEANAAKVEAIMDSVAVSAQKAGEALGSIFSDVGQMRDAGLWRHDIERWIEAQIAMQQEALAIQREMAFAEIALMNARAEALRRGDALITVSGEGLQPHLESFMFELLEAVQIKATEEGAAFLVGV